MHRYMLAVWEGSLNHFQSWVNFEFNLQSASLQSSAYKKATAKLDADFGCQTCSYFASDLTNI